MKVDPQLEFRSALPYMGIPAEVSLHELPKVIPELLDEVGRWLRANDLAPSGPPFVRYSRIDMPHRLSIEVCMPVMDAPPGDGRVRGNEVPEGRYAVLVHEGPASELVGANEALQQWAREKGIAFRLQQSDPSIEWTARTETYLTDPSTGRDGAQRTEIAYLTKE